MVVMFGIFRFFFKKRMICRICLYIFENIDLFGMMRKNIIDIIDKIIYIYYLFIIYGIFY